MWENMKKSWDSWVFCKPFWRWSNSICGYRDNANNQSTPESSSTKEQWDWKVREEQNQNTIGLLTLIKSEMMEDSFF